MTSDSALILYHTDGCHLCEIAEAILAEVVASAGVSFGRVDIASDDGLIERYGTRIPVVLRVADQTELNWPFDHRQLDAWLAAPS
jgi:hypothetical protein